MNAKKLKVISDTIRNRGTIGYESLLLDEINRLRKDKEHWEDGWVEVEILKAKNNALQKAAREILDKIKESNL